MIQFHKRYIYLGITLKFSSVLLKSKICHCMNDAITLEKTPFFAFQTRLQYFLQENGILQFVLNLHKVCHLKKVESILKPRKKWQMKKKRKKKCANLQDQFAQVNCFPAFLFWIMHPTSQRGCVIQKRNSNLFHI